MAGAVATFIDDNTVPTCGPMDAFFQNASLNAFGYAWDVPADGQWVTISQNGFADNLGTAITITNIGSAFDDDLWISLGGYTSE